MNFERSTQVNKTSKTDAFLPKGILQRKCDCGQHTHGVGECEGCRNKKLNQLLQTKLQIGESNDRFEQEADRVADAVVRSWNTSTLAYQNTEGQTHALSSANNFDQSLYSLSKEVGIQRQTCSIGGENLPLIVEEVDEETSTLSEQEENQSSLISKEQSGVIQRKFSASPCTSQYNATETIQGQSAVNNSLSLGRNSGRPLPFGLRQGMEARIGADFSSVRIHTDFNAERMSHTLGARAFTYGRDIFFNRGEFNPVSSKGKHLLAHELTHTLQQNGNTLRRLAINPVGNLARGPCGRYARRWDFELGAAATAPGYIVQQIDFYENIVDCPLLGQCTANPNLTFWEAWPVKQNETLHELHSSAGFTDQSSYPGRPTKVGYVAAVGDIKFYLKSVTGDLGTYNTAPASPNGGWGPNASGQSGSLPSTLTRPSWWGTAPTEGPGSRGAWASWRCCGDSDDFNSIQATP